MPLQIVRNDITKMKVDAIVNAANSSLLGGGGVDGAIHQAAGPELLAECRKLHGCKPGDAKLTGGYRLPCKYVIHTVGPIWQGGGHGEEETLRSAYWSSLALAVKNHCDSVAFPLISAGAYGYPKDAALRVATETIQTFLQDHELQIYIVVYDRRSFQLSRSLLNDVAEFVDQTYVDAHPYPSRPGQYSAALTHWKQSRRDESTVLEDMRFSAPAPKAATCPAHAVSEDDADFSLDKMLSRLDESFSQMLLRKIDEKGMSDAQCYKKANIDRKLFSKIRKDKNYKPSKPTAIAFAIALELDLEEAEELLQKAGYALSPSSKFDVIIEYFLLRRRYDIFEINEVLFYYDQSLLGAG